MKLGDLIIEYYPPEIILYRIKFTSGYRVLRKTKYFVRNINSYIPEDNYIC